MQRGFINAASPRVVTIGILGGGQLALMLARAASQLGLKTRVLDPSPVSPARHAVSEYRQGDWSDFATLRDFAKDVDVITLENEFVPASHLAELERVGHKVVPSSGTVGLVQDKYVQKQTLRGAGVPVVEFKPVVTERDASNAGSTLGYPFVLKKRTLGYDGLGNRTVAAAHEIPAAIRDSADARLDCMWRNGARMAGNSPSSSCAVSRARRNPIRWSSRSRSITFATP